MQDLSRRGFLGRTIAAAAVPVLSLAPRSRPQAPLGRATALPGGPGERWVERARAEIPAATNYGYFQTAGIGPSPTPVLDVVSAVLHRQNRGPAAPEVASVISPIEPDLRAHLARAFGARENEVALTHSTSEGLNIVSWAFNWKEGDEVVVTNQEHPSNVIPWYTLRDRFGVRTRVVDFSAGTDLVGQIRAALNARTRLVSIPHVSRNNGRRVTADESAALADMLRKAGVYYHLDGAQGPGCVPFDFAALGCDAYSTCGHKWLLGPKGTGAFFVREAMLERTLMSWTGAHSHATMDYEGGYTLLPSAARFEFGTRAHADFAGFDAAVSWMEAIGFDRIHGRIDALVEYAIEKARSLRRFGIASPVEAGARSGVFVLRLPEDADAGALYHRLAGEKDILASPVREARDLRIAIHFFNTTDEIDEAFDAIEQFTRG